MKSIIQYRHHHGMNQLTGYKLVDNVLHYNTQCGVGSIEFKNVVIARRCMTYLQTKAKSDGKATTELLLLDRVNRKHRSLGYQNKQTWVAQFNPTSIH